VVRVWKNDALLAAPLIDISAVTNDHGDRGLLGMTLDPTSSRTAVYLLYSCRLRRRRRQREAARLSRCGSSGIRRRQPPEDCPRHARQPPCSQYPRADCIADFPSTASAVRIANDGTCSSERRRVELGRGQRPSLRRRTSTPRRKLIRVDADGEGLADNPSGTATNAAARRSGRTASARLPLQCSPGQERVIYAGDVAEPPKTTSSRKGTTSAGRATRNGNQPDTSSSQVSDALWLSLQTRRSTQAGWSYDHGGRASITGGSSHRRCVSSPFQGLLLRRLREGAGSSTRASANRVDSGRRTLDAAPSRSGVSRASTVASTVHHHRRGAEYLFGVRRRACQRPGLVAGRNRWGARRAQHVGREQGPATGDHPLLNGTATRRVAPAASDIGWRSSGCDVQN
jgi:hypothetical protein